MVKLTRTNNSYFWKCLSHLQCSNGGRFAKIFFHYFLKVTCFIFFLMETICCEISCDKGCWWWKFLWTVMDRTFNNVLIIVLLLKWTKIISLFLQIIITALGQREAAGPKETGVPNNILASSVPIPHYLPPQIFTDTEKWEWAVAFFLSRVTCPPPWWPSDRSSLRSIAVERRRPSVGWWCRAEGGIGGGRWWPDVAAVGT